MEKEMETLKQLFSNSADHVFIVNYNQEILWYNKDILLDFFEKFALKSLFEGRETPLESGEHIFKNNGLDFPCQVINYREEKLYIIELNGDETFYSCIKHDSLKAFLINQAAQVRQAVTGITFAGSIVQKILDEAEVEDDARYVDISVANSHKLLRAVLNTVEIAQYTDVEMSEVKLDLNLVLSEFTGICRGIFTDRISVNLKSRDRLYFRGDYERLMNCLLCLTVLAGKNVSNCGKITFEAKKEQKTIFLTVRGFSGTEPANGRVLSHLERLYQSDNADSDLAVVNCFCRKFSVDFLACDSEEEGKIYSLKFPFCDNPNLPLKVYSTPVSFYSDKFSKFHIALSEIVDIL